MDSLKRKREFSKIILFYAAIVNTVVIAITLVLVIVTRDLSPLYYLIPSVGAEVATGTAFYYSKARVENKIKLMAAYKVPPNENSFD